MSVKKGSCASQRKAGQGFWFTHGVPPMGKHAAKARGADNAPAKKQRKGPGFKLPLILVSVAVVGIAVLVAIVGVPFLSLAATNSSAPANPPKPQTTSPPKKKKTKKPSTEPLKTAAQQAAIADVDSDPSCPNWARDGECQKNPAFMSSTCAKSCAGKLPKQFKDDELANLLDDVVDLEPHCATWAAQGECANNPTFMAASCARSCAGMLSAEALQVQQQPSTKNGQKTTAKGEVKSVKVDWSPPTLPADLAAAQAEADAERVETRRKHGGRMWPLTSCADARPDCAELARANLSACGEAEVMLTSCPQTCRTCGHHDLIAGISECQDTNEACPGWAASGGEDRTAAPPPSNTPIAPLPNTPIPHPRPNTPIAPLVHMHVIGAIPVPARGANRPPSVQSLTSRGPFLCCRARRPPARLCLLVPACACLCLRVPACACLPVRLRRLRCRVRQESAVHAVGLLQVVQRVREQDRWLRAAQPDAGCLCSRRAHEHV